MKWIRAYSKNVLFEILGAIVVYLLVWWLARILEQGRLAIIALMLLIWVLLLSLYRRFIYIPKRALDSGNRWPILDALIWAALSLTIGTMATVWFFERQAYQQELLQCTRKRIRTDLLPGLREFMRQREALGSEVELQGYFVDDLVISLFHRGADALIMHSGLATVMPDLDSSEPPKIRFGHLGETPPPDSSVYPSLDIFSDGKWLRIDSSKIRRSSKKLGETQAVSFEAAGHSGTFKFRRRMCWEGTMRRDYDAFLIDLQEYPGLRGRDFRVNFYSTQKLHPTIHVTALSQTNDTDASLTGILRVKEVALDPNAPIDQSPCLAGFQAVTRQGWAVRREEIERFLSVAFIKTTESTAQSVEAESGDTQDKPEVR